LGLTRRKHVDACTHATLFVDDLESSPSQHRCLRSSERRTHKVGGTQNQHHNVCDDKRNDKSLSGHRYPPVT